eukprot:gene57865-biopygen44113
MATPWAGENSPARWVAVGFRLLGYQGSGVIPAVFPTPRSIPAVFPTPRAIPADSPRGGRGGAGQLLTGGALRDAALRAGDVVWERGVILKGNGLCHGIAGNGYTFLS